MPSYGHSNPMMPNQRPPHQMAPMSSAGVGGPMMNGMMTRNRQAPYPTPQQYMMQKRGQNVSYLCGILMGKGWGKEKNG